MDEITDEIYTCDYNNLKIELEKIPFNKKVGLVVMLNDIKYEFLLNLKLDSDSLICLGPSGLPNNETMTKFEGRPVFTRHSWDFEESVLSYNDNTRYVWDNCGSGWGLGLPEEYFLENIKNIILKITQFFRIKNKNILFYGSSMGGFTSMQLATMIRDSYAIAENPQIDARNWMNSYYLKNGMDCKLYEESTLKNMEPYRYNVLNMIKKENYVPNLTIIHDINSEDIENHLSRFINELSKLPFKEYDFHKVKIIIEPQIKHWPIPKNKLYEIFDEHDAISKYKYKYKLDYDNLNNIIEKINELNLFNEDFYTHSYPEIGLLDPLTHYLITGWKEGKNPSQQFNTEFYLETYENVRKLGINPLIHYVTEGIEKDLVINEKEFLEKYEEEINEIEASSLFDEEYYKENCDDLENLSPLEHYLLKGWKIGKNPSEEFDTNYYLTKYEGVRKLGVNPLIHYIKFGKYENRVMNKQEEIQSLTPLIKILDNSKLFDEKYYRENCKNLENLSPAEHYLLKGWKEGKNPSKLFDNDYYLDAFPDIRKSNMNPLIHYLKYGRYKKNNAGLKNLNILIKKSTNVKLKILNRYHES